MIFVRPDTINTLSEVSSQNETVKVLRIGSVQLVWVKALSRSSGVTFNPFPSGFEFYDTNYSVVATVLSVGNKHPTMQGKETGGFYYQTWVTTPISRSTTDGWAIAIGRWK